MTDKKQPEPPTHTIWQIVDARRDREGKKIGEDRWLRVGAGWLNKDGKGLNLSFDSYPVVGHISIREVGDREAKENGAQ